MNKRPNASHLRELLVLGVTERAAMGVMGWSSTSVAKGYQHITEPVRQDIAKRVGNLLWAADEPADDDQDDESASDDEDDDGPDAGLTGVRVPAS